MRTLLRFMPAGPNRFIEPFVGSGVVFLNTRYPCKVLSDSNQDLINVYTVLKAKRHDFIERCRQLFTKDNNRQERFYELRMEFNGCTDTERRASIFVYLNRHCFNGLCRYNSKGQFNTPFGRYDHPYFPAVEMLAFADKLDAAELHVRDFRAALNDARGGDVVYCDPPYDALTATARFTSYTKEGFGQKDQHDLRLLAGEASERGALVIISNQDTPFTRNLYAGAAQLETLMVSRTISCDAQNRNEAGELLAVFGEAPAFLRAEHELKA